MIRLNAIFETTQAEYREPWYATDRTAAMAHVACYYDQGSDHVKPIREQGRTLMEHLLQTPQQLRCIYPNWLGIWEYGGPDDTIQPTYNPAKPREQMEYLAESITNPPFTVPFVYLDHEKPDPRGYAARTRFLRACTKPLKDAFNCERVNYTDATFRGTITEWSGFKRITGATIDGTDSVDCYTKKPGDFSRVCRNVLTCRKSGKVIPHLPPKITETQTLADADAQLLAMLMLFAAKGITTFFVAAYERPPELRPALVKTVRDGLAAIESILWPEEAAA